MSGGGGAISCTLSNCLVAANYGGGALKSTLANCVVTGNAGSGVSGGSADGCIISSNTVQNLLGNNNGGGAFQATLTACVLSDNHATNGGGAFNCSLNSCVLSNNVAALIGGGLYMDGAATNGLAGNNLFLSNSAGTHGGGFYLARIGTFVLTNWTFTGNSAKNDGGGFYSANGTEILRGCTITGNSAGGNGGGVSCTASGTILASNCTFTANTAGTNGGGLNLQLGSSLTNCLISSNSATVNGGGVAGGSLTVCSVVGNSAGGNGGGTSSSTVNRCIVSGNRASLNGGGSAGGIVSLSLLTSNLAGFGGGVYSAATLNNSTLTGNVATNNGGGIYATVGTFTSCIIYGNTAPSGTNFASAITLNSCCTTPLPPSGTGNITNNPVFIDPSTGNFRLQTNSPCIDAGSGSPGTTDLDGRPRVVGSKIDIGAYEFQGPGIGEFTAWLQLWGLPVNGSADFTDADTDGLNNWQEWIAGTIPTNSSSVLRLLTPSSAPSGVTLTWQSVSGRTYFLQRAGDLTAQPAFSSIQSNIVGQAGVTSFIDTGASSAGPSFYRVGVQ
jgi:predicted outer membrane repeat protein